MIMIVYIAENQKFPFDLPYFSLIMDSAYTYADCGRWTKFSIKFTEIIEIQDTHGVLKSIDTGTTACKLKPMLVLLRTCKLKI